MKLLRRMLDILQPSELQDLKTDELLSALIDPGVRRKWLADALDEMKAINLRVHTSLMKGTLDDDFAKESARLQGIDWTLRQILIAKNNVAYETHHNQDGDEPSVAVQPAP